MKDFFLGLFLWLGSSFFLLIFIGSNSSKKYSQQSSLSSTKDNLLINQNNSGKNEDQSSEMEDTIKQLEEQLKTKNEELNIAEEYILELDNERELAINKLESYQDKSQEIILKLEKDKDNLQQTIKDLQRQYQDLNQQLEQQSEKLQSYFLRETFEQLNYLLANYPTAKIMIKLKPYLAAENFIFLFKPLENLCQSWGLQTIGKPLQKIPFNPQQHQPDNDNIQENELVYVHFVGYRKDDRILLPAKVSRHLPNANESFTV